MTTLALHEFHAALNARFTEVSGMEAVEDYGDWFWDYFARTSEELTQRLCTALKSFIDLPDKTASACTIGK